LQQTFGISTGTKCGPVDLFLYSYERNFIQRLLKKKRKDAANKEATEPMFLVDKLKSSIQGLRSPSVTWLTAMECLCDK
jgi:hypothetical protein